MAHVYTFEQALDVIINGQYGRDVRQAIYDALYRLFEGGEVGSIDLVAREEIDNLALLVDSSLGEMNLHSGRTKLIDNQTAAVRNPTFTMAKPFTEFDRIWIHVTDVPISDGTSSTTVRFNFGNGYQIPVDIPSATTAKATVDILFDCITATSAVVKVVSAPLTWAIGGGNVNALTYVLDEYSLPEEDEDGNELNMATRVFQLLNCNGATVTVTGYGMKGTDSGTIDGLVIEDGIVHLV